MRVWLKRSILATCLAVPAASGLIGVSFGIALAVYEGTLTAVEDTLNVGGMIALVGCVLAVIPALLYGAPLHALLCKHGKATYVSSVSVGVAPALVIAPFDLGLAGWVFAFGGLIALFTHRFSGGGSQAMASENAA